MNKIFKILSKSLPLEYIKNLDQEYNEIKNSYFIEDKTKIGIHSGRFCELVSSLLCFMELNKVEDLNKIDFNKNIQTLINSSKSNAKEEITRLLIPRTLGSIYTIRSKKKIAHIKNFNPQKIDLKFINIAVDWVLSQLILIYSNIRNDDIINFLETVSYEDYKKVERLENGEILFEDLKMPFSDKILFALLENYNKGRIKKEEISKILNPKNKSYITTYLNNLKKRNLVHVNEAGVVLTKWGIPKARAILKKLNE